jgi:hypothetical protein
MVKSQRKVKSLVIRWVWSDQRIRIERTDDDEQGQCYILRTNHGKQTSLRRPSSLRVGGGIFHITDPTTHKPVAALTLTRSDVTGNNTDQG